MRETIPMKSSAATILYFDCTAGAAGDMLLGALLDLLELVRPGACAEWMERMQPLLASEPGGRCVISEVVRAGVNARKIDFYVDEVHADHFHRGHAAAHRTGHHHAHHTHGDHGHGHDHHDHASHDHRAFHEISSFIHESQRERSLDSTSATLALEIFTTLARAEAEVHGATLDTVHFHEVGAFDSIMDIVGFAIAHTMLGATKTCSSAVTLGSGHVHCAHGTLMVPTPAVRVMLRNTGLPPSGVDHSGECLTPTGAAVLATVVNDWLTGERGEHRTDQIRGLCSAITTEGPEGVGAGTRDSVHPNVVRARLLRGPAEG